MPVQPIIEPTATIAGGVRVGGVDYTVNHNQLSGNTEGKRRKLIELMQDNIFDVRILTTDLPQDDPDRDDVGFNTYDNPYRRGDDSLIDERIFYWQQNPQKKWLVNRSIYADIILVQASDPTIGGNDRYALVLRRTRG